jgi:hypothetical protein
MYRPRRQSSDAQYCIECSTHLEPIDGLNDELLASENVLAVSDGIEDSPRDVFIYL